MLKICGHTSIYRPTSMINGWMTCNFTSFSTVFQSYQGDMGGDNEMLCAIESR